MHPAAVGFQCPECVRAGSRETRSARLPFGGDRSRDPRLTSFGLIALNAAVWLLIVATGGSASVWVERLALLPSGACYAQFCQASASAWYSGGGYVPGVSDGAVWQVVTSMFAHVQVLHIGLNMLTLYFIGPVLESVLGRTRFLAVYLASGLLGSASVMLFSPAHQQTLGASGALFGMLGALAVVTLRVGGNVRSILMWIGLNLVFTFYGGNISWQAHIGGLVGGALLGVAMVYAPRAGRALVQWGAVAAVAAVAVVLIAVQAAALA